jgi:hypothetical protein
MYHLLYTYIHTIPYLTKIHFYRINLGGKYAMRMYFAGTCLCLSHSTYHINCPYSLQRRRCKFAIVSLVELLHVVTCIRLRSSSFETQECRLLASVEKSETATGVKKLNEYNVSKNRQYYYIHFQHFQSLIHSSV